MVRHFHAGEDLAWGGTEVSVLAPEAGYRNDGAPVNDDSLVMRMQYGKASALLEGDAEAPSERAMLADGRMQPVTLLKVGHHGSNSSTTPAVFCRGCAEGCGDLGGQGEYIWASAGRGDRPDCGGAYAALPDG